jgi:hypothetical protein
VKSSTRGNLEVNPLSSRRIHGRLRGIALWLAFASLASPARAHDLAIDELTLFVDKAHGVLRGQITFNPHRTPREEGSSASEIEHRLLALLAESVQLEIDGVRCRTQFEVRELWVPAGATLGDIVMLRCELERAARGLRVFAASSIAALVVSVQTLEPSGAPLTRSVLVPGGSWSPPYQFGGEARGWIEGGPARFLVDGAVEGLARGPTPHTPSSLGALLAAAWQVAARYLELGVRHILQGGWDHIAFVTALVLGSGFKWRSLLLQLSAFTLAHSSTLALAALGLVVLPRDVVEPSIALSIVCVAVANLLELRAEQRFRTALAFGFGLLHGLGFASALSQVGLPRDAFVVALLGFNVGVELGQLVVVFALFALLRWLKEPQQFRRYARRPLSIAIAVLGSYWAIMRMRG